VRAVLIERISPFNPLLQQHGSSGWDVGTATGRSALEQEIGRQAGMIGFNETFFAVMIVALVAVLFALVFKGVRRR
jgi:DHA2 family multidrug resistance protein